MTNAQYVWSIHVLSQRFLILKTIIYIVMFNDTWYSSGLMIQAEGGALITVLHSLQIGWSLKDYSWTRILVSGNRIFENNFQFMLGCSSICHHVCWSALRSVGLMTMQLIAANLNVSCKEKWLHIPRFCRMDFLLWCMCHQFELLL